MTAVFPGSFDPFTIGHLDIVKRFFQIWPNEDLIIAVSVNAGKNSFFPPERRAEQIRDSINGMERVTVTIAPGLISEYAVSAGASFIVRGTRGGEDCENELLMARHNRVMSDIETVLMPAAPEHMIVSSTAVRNIALAGGDPGWMVSGIVREDLKIFINKCNTANDRET